MELNINQPSTTSNFQNLMYHRIHEILLVASPYDAFILEEDGRLTEQILNEYIGMNLSYAPRVWRAETARKAIQMMHKRKFDMVIMMLRISDMDPITFGQNIKAFDSKMPVILLVFDESELKQLPENLLPKTIDYVFTWSGNSNVFPAIIKAIEDKKNVKRDIKRGKIRTIILIEDTPRYYSILLPIIYKEIFYHMRKLISKSLNDSQRLLHLRTRPKILLARSYEEAEKYYKKYQHNTLGIISDIKFPIKGKSVWNAGVTFTKWARDINSYIPIMLHSTNKNHFNDAIDVNAQFLHKDSPNLLLNLRKFIKENFGFGDFVFRLNSGEKITTASNLSEFVERIKVIPNESLIFHVQSNHFSNWLAAHGNFSLADTIRPLYLSGFDDVTDMREFLLTTIHDASRSSQSGKIVEFYHESYNADANFMRISKGSLGGKARGLAFANATLNQSNLDEMFPDINIRIPKTIVIGTEEFDHFMETNDLWDLAINSRDDKEIEQVFLASRLTRKLVQSLKVFLSETKYPLSIRSSSLLEDSQYQPLSGMYATYMISNCSIDNKERLSQLCEAVKRVYASTFSNVTKSMMETISQRLEEEKMAVIVQEVVGQHHGERFYPTLSGVAQSYNYYPVSYMKREEGIAIIALGLGRTIVDGEKALRFSPEYPSILPQYYSIKSTIQNSQNHFYAMKMTCDENQLRKGEVKNLTKYSLKDAEVDGVLKWAGSVICSEDGIVRDSLNYVGVRVITFAKMLKYNQFPLADILKQILEMGRLSLGCPVEIEFAVNMFEDRTKKPEICLLQIKPMIIGNYMITEDTKSVPNENIICRSNVALGNGIKNDINHIIYVKPEDFDSASTQLIANEIEHLNNDLLKGKPYILIGPGRWGTADPWLGVPVTWKQISGAQVIVETSLEDFNIDPSFGSHFFQNVTSLRIGYFTVNPKNPDDKLDWDWLNNQNTIEETNFLKLIELTKPMKVIIDGKDGKGVVLKPAIDEVEIMDETESTGI
jgi:CheY-like chemotaxis protein